MSTSVENLNLPKPLLNFQPRKYYESTDVNHYLVSFVYRYNYIQRNGFPIVTEENLNDLVDLLQGRIVLEPAAGPCTLGEELKKKGINLKTLDIESYQDTDEFAYHPSGYTFITQYAPDIIGYVQEENISRYDAFLISWCDGGDVSTNVLKRMKKGDRLIINGDVRDGCTSSTAFFDLLEKGIKEGRLHHASEISCKMWDEGYRFYSIHDSFNVYNCLK